MKREEKTSSPETRSPSTPKIPPPPNDLRVVVPAKPLSSYTGTDLRTRLASLCGTGLQHLRHWQALLVYWINLVHLADLSNPATASLLRCLSLLQTGQKAQPRHSLLLAPAAKLPLPLFCQDWLLGWLALAGGKKDSSIRQPGLLTLKGSNQPSQSFPCLCDLALHRPVNQRAASSSLRSAGVHTLLLPFKVHHRSPLPSHLRPTWARPGDAVASASRACSSLPPAVPPCLRAHPFYCPFLGPSAPPVPPNRISLSCLASVSSRRSGQGRPILLPQPVSPPVQSPPPPRQEASTTQPFLPRPQHKPSNRPRRPHRRPGRYPRARRWP